MKYGQIFWCLTLYLLSAATMRLHLNALERKVFPLAIVENADFCQNRIFIGGSIESA